MQQFPNTAFRPFVFILKEGKEIKQDYLDYSLQLLTMHGAEKIRSPHIEGDMPQHGPFLACLQENIQSPKESEENPVETSEQST